jgi:hypothetical protein
MRRIVVGLWLLAMVSCTDGPDKAATDTGPLSDQQARGQDTARTDTPQLDASPEIAPDIAPDQSGRAGGTDCTCAPDEGGTPPPPPTCESMGWECLAPDEGSIDGCPAGLHPTDFGDCVEGTVCCVPGEHCFDEGQIFDSDFDVGNCCPGLVEVGNAKGSGNPCSSQTKHRSICTACGDGVCGPFENPCNCQDCPTTPDPTCQDINNTCAEECGEGTYAVTTTNGCPEGHSCCYLFGCLPAGQVVIESYHERCCDGLLEIPATTTGDDGACAPDPDANPICAACPDGTCDEGWENACNCPEDCE